MATHCLDCGAERTADQCSECGLTSAAAEVMLRRRLVRRTTWLLVGALLFVPASQMFPALELDAILIFVGVVFFIAIAMLVWIEQLAKRGKYIEPLKRVFFALVPLPWIFAAFLFINGRFDTSRPDRHEARVVGKFSMPGPWLRTKRLVVLSWRGDRRFERVPVDTDDFVRFHINDELIVQVHGGLLGIPWVAGVERPDLPPPKDSSQGGTPSTGYLAKSSSGAKR
jgi:hypothetical protein